jgi:acyl carrier protein
LSWRTACDKIRVRIPTPTSRASRAAASWSGWGRAIDASGGTPRHPGGGRPPIEEGRATMADIDSIRNTIRQSVNRITGIAPSEIQDTSDYRHDLGLDSLSALEVMVDIEYAYKIKVSEERFQSIKTVQDTIIAVQEYLGAAPA